MSNSESAQDQRRMLHISEKEARAKLVEVFDVSGCVRPWIAVDLDDVLCQTTKCVAEWHNRRFGTDMQIEHFYFSTWYKNPGWGSISTTADKLKEFYDTDQLKHADPVPGSLHALDRLREMGYNLTIVTARSILLELESTLTWVDKHFDGIFCTIVFSSQDSNTLTHDGRCIGTTLSKLQISEQMQSVLLIDDSLETALNFGRNANRPVFLFGDYAWNKRVDTDDPWTFDDKSALEGAKERWKGDAISFGSGDKIWRVQNWDEVIQRLKVKGKGA